MSGRRALPLLTLALVGLVAFVMVTPYAGATSFTTLPHDVPAPRMDRTPFADASEVGPAMGLSRVGGADLATSATVVLTLPIRNQGLLEIFDEEVSEPGTPVYLDFLTPAEFASEFGPTSSTMASVEEWLTSSGLTVSYVATTGTEIDATGSLAALETAFGTTFSDYRASDGSVYWAADTTPSVPAGIVPDLVSIAGLTNEPADVSVPLSHTSGTNAATPDAVYEGTGNLDSADYNHQIFELDQLYNATGNKSAGSEPSYPVGTVVTQGLWSSTGYCGYSTTDLNTFFNDSDGYPSDLPKPVIDNHYTLGGTDEGAAPATGNCGGTVDDDTAAIELTLDLEYSGTDAPGATLAPTWTGGATDADLEHMDNWAVNDISGLDVFTQSWGGGEAANSTGSFERSLQGDFYTAIAEGVSPFVSSADSDGADGGTCADPTDPGLEFPGSSPNVLSVGAFANNNTGDSTYEDLNGANVWNWCGGYNDLDGSTGGVSEAFPAAWYQTTNSEVNATMAWAIKYYTNHDGTTYSTTSARPDPDWSGPGANMQLYFSGAWQTGFGGTSFSSPATAGMVDSIMEFIGHRLGQVGPDLYEFENEYMNHVSGILRPTYSVANGSNAFFNGGQTKGGYGSQIYNTSTGWGAPMALNFSEDLGKPFLSTNPESEPAVGTNYAVTATVKDVQAVSSVDVAYLVPGAAAGGWANATLTLSSGTDTDGVWSGDIPGSALTETGDLRYCVDATDVNDGNSWSPYNMSAWAAEKSETPTNNFGCTVPFVTYVAAGSLTAGSNSLNRTDCELSCEISLNATFAGGTSPYSAAIRWDDGSATQTVTGATASPIFVTHDYTATGTYSPEVFVNTTSSAIIDLDASGASVTVDKLLQLSPITPTLWRNGTGLNESFASASAQAGTGSGTLSTFAWRYGNGESATTAAGLASVYYYIANPTGYLVTLNVTDSFGYKAAVSLLVPVYGTLTPVHVYDGWNLLTVPGSSSDYTLYEISTLVSGHFVSVEDVTTGTTYTPGATSGNLLVKPGEALWLDLTGVAATGQVVDLYGNSTTFTEDFAAGAWEALGWSEPSSTTAAGIVGDVASGTITEVSVWNASSQTWVTYQVGWDAPTSWEGTLALYAGEAFLVWGTTAGGITE